MLVSVVSLGMEGDGKAPGFCQVVKGVGLAAHGLFGWVSSGPRLEEFRFRVRGKGLEILEHPN